jgi:hypothetical protein
MRHSYRSFRVTDLAGAAELVDLLVVTAETPSRCAGYRLQSGHGSLLFLCDDGHDTLRDYAVFDERTQSLAAP